MVTTHLPSSCRVKNFYETLKYWHPSPLNTNSCHLIVNELTVGEIDILVVQHAIKLGKN